MASAPAVLRSCVANYRARGGTLMLTAEHVIFVPSLGSQRVQWDVREVHAVTLSRALGLVPNAITIHVGDLKVKAVIAGDRQGWVHAIMEAAALAKRVASKEPIASKSENPVNEVLASPPPTPATPDEITAVVQTLRAQQRFEPAFASGIVAVLVGSVVWRLVFERIGAETSRPEIWAVSALAAYGCGAAVGGVIRLVGHGLDGRFALLGAVSGFATAYLGDFFLAIAGAPKVAPWAVIAFASHRGLGDFVIYLIALAAGSQLAVQTRTTRELERLAIQARAADVGERR